jgi:TRAP-type C4-dicarboxylate transport system substrate-binding protein
LYQSGLTAQGCWDELDDYAQQGIEKFAELIVKKCANIVWDEAEKTMSSEVNDAGYKIIEYFGVEE